MRAIENLISWGLPGVAAIAALLSLVWLFIPQWNLLLRRLRRACPTPTLALTFDDGPMEPWTSRILDILAEHRVRATFFVLGERAQQSPHLIHRIIAEGHALGNHTMSHPRLTFHRTRRAKQEVDDCNSVLKNITGIQPTLFRAPHGFRHPRLNTILRERTMTNIPWTRGVWDTNRPPADVIVRRATQRPQSLEILLLHDGTTFDVCDHRDRTVEALPHIIASYRRSGSTFVTIPELLQRIGR